MTPVKRLQSHDKLIRQTRVRTLVASTLAVAIVLLRAFIMPAQAAEVIYIRADGTVDPPTYSIQRDNSVYVFTNNVTQPITVQKSDVVIDGSGFYLIGNGENTGFSIEKINNTEIRNVKIAGFDFGIHVTNSLNTQVLNNTIGNCTYGIVVDQSPRSQIIGNNLRNNKWDGIFTTNNAQITISNNTVADNDKWGIFLGNSEATMRGNNITHNRYNLGVSAQFTQDIDTSNTINNKPVHYWVEQRNRQVPANAGYIAIVRSQNITIRNFELKQNGQGVLLVNSESSTIENCHISEHAYHGLQLIESKFNMIRNNTMTHNEWSGVAFTASSSNTLINNTIQDNEKGLTLTDSYNNVISQNNFISNRLQVFSQDSTNNWDTGQTLSGNYWSDYTGIDTDSDGTGDTPYKIDAANQDRYPLMEPVTRIIAEDNSASLYPAAIALTMLTVAVVLLLYFTRKRQT